MSDTFGPFIVKRGSDGTTFPTEVGRVNAPGPYTLDDLLADADPARSPTGKWIYTINETTSGNVVVPYNSVKIDSVKQGTCQKLWQISPSGQGDARCAGLRGDAAGNMIATGWFSGTGNFGNGNKTSSGGGGAQDIFLVKYNSNNQIVFYNQYGNGSHANANAVTVDGAGNVIITGDYNTVKINLGGSDLQPLGPNNLTFVAKYNGAGTHQWSAATAAGTGTAIAVDSGDDVYVLSKDVSGNILLKKLLGTDGSVAWTNTVSNNSGASALGIAVSTNKVLITGSFFDSLDYGAGTLSGGGMFLIQFNTADGSFATLAKSYAGCVGRAIAIAPTGNIIVTGSVANGKSVGGDAASGPDQFIAGYRPNGDFLWQYLNGYSVLVTGRAVTINTDGYLVYVSGCSGLYFGPGTDSLSGNGATDYGAAAFVASGDTKPVWKWSKVSGQPNATGTSEGFACGIDSGGRVFTGGYFNQMADFGDGFLGSAASAQAAGFIAQYSA